MISIIANPELYDGKNVQVCGVLHLNYEDIALYLTKEDADYIRSENALCVAFSEDTVTFQPENWGSFSVKNIDVHGFKTPWERERVLHLNGKAVMVNGTYNAERNTVYNISHVQEEHRWYDGGKCLGESIPGNALSARTDSPVTESIGITILVLAVLALILCSFAFVKRVRS